MGRINRHNYESFLLDYMEGTLHDSLHAEMLAFLDENPDIREELMLLDDVVLVPDEKIFSGKETLKKEVVPVNGLNESNYINYFIAYHEGDLADQEKKSVNKFLQKNPHLEPEFKTFSKVFLTPDAAVNYPGKEHLKKKERPVLMWVFSGLAAALLLLLLGLNFLMKTESGHEPLIRQNQTAEVKNQTPEMVTDTRKDKNQYAVTKKEIQNIEKVEDQTPETKVQKTPVKKYARVKRVKEKKPFTPTMEIVELNPKSPEIALIDYTPYERIRKKHMRRLQFQKVERPGKRSMTGALLAGLMQKAKNELPVPVTPQRISQSKEPALAKVMDGGITVLSTLTGAEPEVEKLYNGDGELIAYRISGEQFNITKSFNKNDR